MEGRARRRWALGLLGVLSVLGAASASADGRGPASPPQALTLRPADPLESLAERSARVLRRRTGARVRVAGPPPGAIGEAVPSGQVALMPAQDGVRLVMPRGRDRYGRTQLALGDTGGPAAARAVALAVESLRDAPAHGPAGEQGSKTAEPQSDVPTSRQILASPPAGRDRLHAERDMAKPTIFARMMLGVSPVQGKMLVGPGAGLGLCVDENCLVLEGDLSLLPMEAQGQAGTIRYRHVNAAIRLQLRPWKWKNFVFGFTAGLLTRMGRATLVGTDISQNVSNFGVRSSFEASWRFAPPLEMVFEAGVDVAVSRAKFIHVDTTYLEDRWTPWLVTSLRVRP